MKRKFAILMAVVLSTVISIVPAFAENSVDFSDMLSELKTLMDECAEKGIPTDYELVNYATIEQFEDYINQDIQNEMSNTDYTICCIEDLYTEAKTNLVSYLSGEKQAIKILRPNMHNLKSSGGLVYDGKTPVISIGYGYFNDAINSIPDFYKFGAGTIQMEIGPTTVLNDSSAISKLKNNLQTAQDNNIAVSLLLAPHYFPDNLSEDIYSDKAAAIKYNINAPKAREIIENHIRTVLSQVSGYTCIDNICLSNEPQFKTTWYYDFYNPLFQEYLEKKHGTLDKLNDAYGSNYNDFFEINMPVDLTNAYNGLSYDWIEFNDKTFADWHSWMADIVGEYMPDTPVHSKVMQNFWGNEHDDRMYLTRGTDFELFAEFCDYSGNDSSDFYDENFLQNYYASMFFYDFQQSLFNKPVYNSEEHIIEDGNTVFNKEHTQYVLNHMWQGAIHGRGLSTIWIWDRSYVATHPFYGSVLFRPDAVAGIGKIGLDFMRLSDEISELQKNSEKVAIYYSKPSRLYNKRHFGSVIKAYKELTKVGIDTGVVTDRNIKLLSNYDTLIIPDATNCKAETLTAIENFIDAGGNVYCTESNVLGADEYNNAIDNSYIIANSTLFDFTENRLSISEKPQVTIEAENFDGLDWQYSVTENRILINLTNMSGYNDVKNVSVYYNGEKLEGMTELITNTKNIGTVVLNGYEPKFLEYVLKEYEDTKITDISADENRIYWETVGTEYSSTNIYLYNSDRRLSFLENTTGLEFSYEKNGTYIVCPVMVDGTECEGKAITVSNENAVQITALHINGSTVGINIENLTEDYVYGTIVAEFFDDAGARIGYGGGKTFIRPDYNHQMTISVSCVKKPHSVRITMYDDINTKKILYSNELVMDI